MIIGTNDITVSAPWMIPYFQGGYEEAQQYRPQSSCKVYFKCPYCEKIMEKSMSIYDLYRRKNISCTCSDNISYPEKFFRNLLDEMGIDYIYQLSKSNDGYSWCQNYRYDFYLPCKDMIIETNGEQHYKNAFNKDVSTQENIDLIKKELAIKNGVKYYVELDCRKSDKDYIYKSIIESGIIDILKINIEDINWYNIEQKSRKNILKEVCVYFNENVNASTDEIATKFHLDNTTVWKYLNIGNKLNWCEYSSILALKRGQRKTKEMVNQRRIELYGEILVFDKEKQLIGKYKNQYEVVRELKKQNIVISVSSVGQALKKETHFSKGLYFIYENEIKEADKNVSCK